MFFKSSPISKSSISGSSSNEDNNINRHTSDSTIDSGNKSLSSPEKAENENDNEIINAISSSSRIASDSWYTTTNNEGDEERSVSSSRKFGQSPAAKRVKKLFSRYSRSFNKSPKTPVNKKKNIQEEEVVVLLNNISTSSSMTSITQAPELLQSEITENPIEQCNALNNSLNNGGIIQYYNLNINKFKCLGITIIGQTTPEGNNVGIYCGGITPNSAAFEFFNFIDVGDRIVTIDREDIRALTNDEAVQFLQFKVNDAMAGTLQLDASKNFVEIGVLKFPEAYTEDEDFRHTEITSETYTTYSESQSTLASEIPSRTQNLKNPRVYNENFQNLQKTNTWINNHRSSFHELNRANSLFGGSPNRNIPFGTSHSNTTIAREATLCKNTKLSEFKQHRKLFSKNSLLNQSYIPQPVEFSLEASSTNLNNNNGRNTSGNISDFSGKSVRSNKNSNNSVTFSDQLVDPIDCLKLRRINYSNNLNDLSIDTPMRSVIKLINNPLSNLKIKDRNWLRVIIKNSFLGADLVDWLHENLVGLEDRRDAKTYASTLYQGQMVRATIQARRDKFSEKSLYCF